jgi:hypothetical protein
MHIHVFRVWCPHWVMRLHLSWFSIAFDLVEWGMSVSMHVWEITGQIAAISSLPSTKWVPGFELRSAGLVASTLTH